MMASATVLLHCATTLGPILLTSSSRIEPVDQTTNLTNQSNPPTRLSNLEKHDVPISRSSREHQHELFSQHHPFGIPHGLTYQGKEKIPVEHDSRCWVFGYIMECADW
jgi:hypothetical protein